MIDFYRRIENPKSGLFHQILNRNITYGIASFTFTEILQGSKGDREYNELKEYLSSLPIYFPPESTSVYEKAAYTYYTLRRKGITPRSNIDIFIALTAIEFDLFLLHNDNDFDAISSVLPDLRILNRLHG